MVCVCTRAFACQHPIIWTWQWACYCDERAPWWPNWLIEVHLCVFLFVCVCACQGRASAFPVLGMFSQLQNNLAEAENTLRAAWINTLKDAMLIHLDSGLTLWRKLNSVKVVFIPPNCSGISKSHWQIGRAVENVEVTDSSGVTWLYSWVNFGMCGFKLSKHINYFKMKIKAAL